MAKKDDEQPQGSGAAPDESTGPEAQTSGPVPSGDAAAEGSEELTVDDILGAAQTEDAAAEDQKFADLESALMADLKRLQAEYANYRKRVDRDRQLVADNATYKALTPIIDVLDTVDRAREHGELETGLKTVADQLERTVAQQGLVKFGEPGDAFDPNIHEALSHIGEDPEVSVTTCKVVAKAGYRMGDRVVRAAQVLVVDPASQDSHSQDSQDS